MQRNKLIYALAQAALVVNSDLNKGGTWAGAVEQLDKLHFVPLYVRSSGAASPGLDALRGRGALSWPDPVDAADATSMVREAPPPVVSHSNPAESLFDSVREAMLRLLITPMKDTEVAAALDVSKVQARLWLNRLVQEGSLEKRKKPAGYISRQRGLFE